MGTQRFNTREGSKITLCETSNQGYINVEIRKSRQYSVVNRKDGDKDLKYT